MYRDVIFRMYKDIIPDFGARTPEEYDELIKQAIEESKKLTDWPDPEDYR